MGDESGSGSRFAQKSFCSRFAGRGRSDGSAHLAGGAEMQGFHVPGKTAAGNIWGRAETTMVPPGDAKPASQRSKGGCGDAVSSAQRPALSSLCQPPFRSFLLLPPDLDSQSRLFPSMWDTVQRGDLTSHGWEWRGDRASDSTSLEYPLQCPMTSWDSARPLISSDLLMVKATDANTYLSKDWY